MLKTRSLEKRNNMGTIRKIGDEYFIEFTARGLKYQQKIGPDQTRAEQALKDIEAQIARGEALAIVREIDLAVFFEQFLVYTKDEFGSKTANRFMDVTGHFKAFLKRQYPDKLQLSAITPSIFEAYKMHLTSSFKPVLVNFSILLLREMMEYGIKLGFINDNPTLHIRLLPWTAKNPPVTKRYKLVRDLFAKGAGLGKICKLLSLSDIARILYYRNLIPLSREDMYN